MSYNGEPDKLYYFLNNSAFTYKYSWLIIHYQHGFKNNKWLIFILHTPNLGGHIVHNIICMLSPLCMINTVISFLTEQQAVVAGLINVCYLYLITEKIYCKQIANVICNLCIKQVGFSMLNSYVCPTSIVSILYIYILSIPLSDQMSIKSDNISQTQN